MKASEQKRLLRPCIAWALLFAVLGVANVWIGYSKRLYYVEAVGQKAARNEGMNAKSTIHRKRVLSRIDYYSLVYNGGICFLAVSAALFSLAVAKPCKPHVEDKEVAPL